MTKTIKCDESNKRYQPKHFIIQLQWLRISPATSCWNCTWPTLVVWTKWTCLSILLNALARAGWKDKNLKTKTINNQIRAGWKDKKFKKKKSKRQKKRSSWIILLNALRNKYIIVFIHIFNEKKYKIVKCNIVKSDLQSE